MDAVEPWIRGEAGLLVLSADGVSGESIVGGTTGPGRDLGLFEGWIHSLIDFYFGVLSCFVGRVYWACTGLGVMATVRLKSNPRQPRCLNHMFHPLSTVITINSKTMDSR